MSSGQTIPAARALAIVARLREELPGDLIVCGSLRRGKPTVSDIDLCCALPDPDEPDLLYDAISQSLNEQRLPGRPGKGLKRHFKSCDLLLRCWEGTPHAAEVKIEFSRFTPDNCGWTILRRTGPREFGIWFLAQWKAMSKGEKGSHEGHLVDAAWNIVPVPTEEACFGLIDRPYIEPANRDAFMQHVLRR